MQAKANRGILYVDEVNLLDDHLVDVLLDSAASGWNTVEREGISISHPARFILVGSGGANKQRQAWVASVGAQGRQHRAPAAQAAHSCGEHQGSAREQQQQPQLGSSSASRECHICCRR